MPYTIELRDATVADIRAEQLSKDGGSVDSFDFKAPDDSGAEGLLLPAVQAAREAARSGDGEAGLRSDGELVQAVSEGDSDPVLVRIVGNSGGDGELDQGGGLRSDGDLVQSVAEGDAGFGDFLF